MSAFEELTTLTGSTTRSPDISGGKRGTPAANLSGLSLTPLDPVDPELAQRLHLDTPHELLQTFVEGDLDILEGDILVVDSVEYPIRSVAKWEWKDTYFCRLVIEELKQ